MPNDFHNTTHVESRSRAELRNFIIQSSTLLEISLSGLVLIGLLISIVPLIQWMPGLFIDGNDVEIRTFLERALDIVIGIEFIKMLAKHSPGSSLEVLLYAIARFSASPPNRIFPFYRNRLFLLLFLCQVKIVHP